MAHHRDNHNDPPLTSQNLSSVVSQNPSSIVPSTGEEEVAVDVDEPPDNHNHFSCSSTPLTRGISANGGYFKLPPSTSDRKASLLTQALLTGPDSKPPSRPPASPMSRATSTASNYSTTSAVSTAELTSDGGLTSPARTSTPSPPKPSMTYGGLPTATPKPLLYHADEALHSRTPNSDGGHSAATVSSNTVGASTDRKRCITFACGIDSRNHDKALLNAGKVTTTQPGHERNKPADPPKRPCLLRFACPSKLPLEVDGRIENDSKAQVQPLISPPANLSPSPRTSTQPNFQDRDTHTMSENNYSTETEVPSSVTAILHPLPRQAKHRPEGIRFHEFASAYHEEDEWLYERPVHRHKITVNDTLWKENAIRKLGEEAENEALEEEYAEEDADLETESGELATDNDSINGDGDDDEEEEPGSENEASDGGNETDDEGGFADSDDETDVDSEYQFWTPGWTTAVTSTDYTETIRARTQRNGSQSSIDSTDKFNAITIKQSESGRGRRKSRRLLVCGIGNHGGAKLVPKMRPGTPDLPDSTDFVCGTLDEDRPLEAAYLSCLEQKRIARHPVIPQDFDPSFPTSDMDEEDEDEDENEAIEASDEHMWITGRPDDSDADENFHRQKRLSKQNAKSPAPSPKRFRSPPAAKSGGRMRSPPPPKRRANHRSPPPRRLFGAHSPRRMRSPPPPHLRNLNSPPSSRRPSFSSVTENQGTGIDLRQLAQRPNLTHTKSLPRTPNPFWKEHRRLRLKTKRADTERSSKLEGDVDGEMHSRGPIDIVQGLENKRQRRKEKFWRQHCRNAGKEKERRCQPGKGAERMRELGLEMAGRSKAYGQRGQLVLSI